MPVMTRPAARPTSAKKPATAKSKGGGAVFLGVAAVGGILAWWLLRGRLGAPPQTVANPVVDVGDDRAVTLDATSHAEIVINFSVVADNPVNLVWTRTSGPGNVAFSPVGPNQELAEFQTPGTYFLRLTAIDTTDSRATGFDELVVTVNEFLLAAILVPGELKVDGFASYTLTRELGDTISFVWPVTNVGNLQGAAYIELTEAGLAVGAGAPFPIDPGMTVAVNFNPVVNLPIGVHILAARVMEGLPPDGVPAGAAQLITLTVVSIPVLAALGLPTINGGLGDTAIGPGIRPNPYSITWGCQNSGSGSGRARLRVTSAPLYSGGNVTGGLVTIPGFSTVTLLLSVPTSFTVGGRTYTVTLTMEDDTGVILGTWQFTLAT